MPPRKSNTAAAAAAKPETPAVVGRRRSQRVSTSASASTDKKSRYFTAESEGSEAELDVKATPAPKKRGRPSGSASAKKAPPAKRVKKAAVESEEAEEAGETPFEESQPEEEEEEEEEEVKPVKKAARGRKAKVVIHQDKGEKANVGKRRVAKQVADSDAEDAVPTKKPGRPAAKKTQPPTDDDEEDDDSDARPKVVFIPHAKIRDDGGVPYTDDLVHPNTLEFLKDLKANNVRSWLKSNDGEFRRALKDWESYATALTDTIIDLDPTIPELPFKDINFRIYRDIRFTNDPTPYKPHFSAAWSRTGRKGPYACYYLHMEPNRSSFIAGGLWHPSAPSLARLRASIDAHPARWRRVLTNPSFLAAFFPDVFAKSKKKSGKALEEAAVAAFAAGNAEGALKTKPKGYDAEHRDIGLLKLRSFTVSRKVPDGWWMEEGGGRRWRGWWGRWWGLWGF